MSQNLSAWSSVLACPLDHYTLIQNPDGALVCSHCGFSPPLIENKGWQVLDFRAQGTPQTVSVSFTLPITPLDRYQLAQTHFRAPAAARASSTSQVKLKTKLDAGCQYYLRQLLAEHGADVPILDLGCGSGDNTRFLREIGFRNILPVDWSAVGAEILVDAHRLPLKDRSFRIVVSTAVFEHLYNPFVAMSEISRVLDDQGCFLGGASFWEAWHGSSYFHLTPDAWNVLLNQNALYLNDLWAGWGIVPAAISHVLTPGHFRRLGYGIQGLIERVYRLWGGEMAVRKFQLRASGSYMVYATRHQ
ncbi:MAG: class I SAM-dependent methyltransferase [Anaerolineae bacterium]